MVGKVPEYDDAADEGDPDLHLEPAGEGQQVEEGECMTLVGGEGAVGRSDNCGKDEDKDRGTENLPVNQTSQFRDYSTFWASSGTVYRGSTVPTLCPTSKTVCTKK